MKAFPAKAQRRKDRPRFSFAPLRLCGKKFIAITIALSFIATVAPIAGASADKSSSMPCCAGKAGHCDSGLVPKRSAPPKEPMCGLHGDNAEDDGITIVAEPSHAESHKTTETSSSQPAAESASLSQPCHMDCGACAMGSTRQQKRERSIILSNTDQIASVATSSRYEDKSLLFSSSDNWPQINPRGPPARR
jgi:hypothetical protein